MSSANDLRRRAARRSLLLGALVYVALQVPLAILAEHAVGVRDPMYGDKANKLLDRIEEKTIDGTKPTTVVMLGSSRTGYGFHGLRAETVLEAELDKPAVAYNFGVPASGPITQLLYLRRLLEDGVEPDLLLVEVLPSMLATDVVDVQTGKQLVPLEQLWFFPDRLRGDELAIVERCGFDSEKTREKWRDTIIHPWHSLRFQLVGRVMPGWLRGAHRYDWGAGSDCCGWDKAMKQTISPEDYRIGVERARGEYQAVLANLKPGGGAGQALRQVLQIARDRQIPTVLVLMPEGTDFQSWYSTVVRERIDKFMTDLKSEFSVETIDARDWLPDSGFSDSHHMLTDGAVTFSERLTREAIVPRLSPEPEVHE